MMLRRLFRSVIKFSSISAVTLSIIGSLLAFQCYQFLHRPLLVAKEGYILDLPTGISVPKIAAQLSQAGVLKSPKWFLVGVYLKGAWNQLKAGEYLVKAGSTSMDLIQQLREGRVIQHALTIVPGWNFERLLLEVNQSPVLIHTLEGLNFADIMARLGHPGEHPEGQFLPETYYFPKGTTDVAFLQRAYNFLQQTLATLWDGAKANDLPLKSKYEALILASIIEKESSILEEYPDIAGVYIRRLIKKMPLQADPTVAYGAGSAYAGTLTRKLLEESTPYNTYKIIGLPPTPIALPSHGALRAALNPKTGDTLYFVAKGNGKGHVFSKTLAEHQAAVKQYRKALLEAKLLEAKEISKTETKDGNK